MIFIIMTLSEKKEKKWKIKVIKFYLKILEIQWISLNIQK